jgi:HSP20 family protein
VASFLVEAPAGAFCRVHSNETRLAKTHDTLFGGETHMFDTVFARDVQHTLDHFRRSVDQLFNSLYSSDGRTSGSTSQGRETSNQVVFSPVIESGWNDNALCVRAIVPGVGENDLRVSMQANQLLIEGERKAPENWTKAYTQLPYGKFYAALTLPHGLDFDKLNCRLREGVLDITIPVGDQLKPKQIQIQTEQKAINS